MHRIFPRSLCLLGILACFSAFHLRMEAASLVGQYTFESDSGNSIYNSATATYDATNVGSTLVDQVSNNYRTFDGSDYINPPEFLPGSSSYSLMTWFQSTSTSRMDLLAAGGTYVLALNSSESGTGKVGSGVGQLRFSQKTDGSWDTAIYSNSTTLGDGKWHCVTVTYDGGHIYMYVDGALQTASSVGSGALSSGTATGTSLNDLIGTQSTSTSYAYAWNGAIDDVRYYSGALSGSEVQTIYNATKSLYAVPEPSALALVVAGTLLFFVRRRKSQDLGRFRCLR